MPIAAAGFVSSQGRHASEFLVMIGPGLLVQVSADPPGGPREPLPTGDFRAAGEVLALIDTGASESCIDQFLADQLTLPLVDRRIVSGAGGRHDLNVYLGYVHIPAIGLTQSGLFSAVKLTEGGGAHRVLLGRTMLRNVIMIYDGREGTVSICV